MIFVNGLIRVIIAMALLPVAQICVTYFFLYTTSGLGLLINENTLNIVSVLSKVMAHMNDNNGKDINNRIEDNDFYETINKTPFFKWWVNEYFISSMLTIYWVVKLITVPLLLSKPRVKIIMAIALGVLTAGFIARFIYKYGKYKTIMPKDVVRNIEDIQVQVPDNNNPPPSAPPELPYEDQSKLSQAINPIELKSNPLNNDNGISKDLADTFLHSDKIITYESKPVVKKILKEYENKRKQ